MTAAALRLVNWDDEPTVRIPRETMRELIYGKASPSPIPSTLDNRPTPYPQVMYEADRHQRFSCRVRD
jgi:hypothetical protein